MMKERMSGEVGRYLVMALAAIVIAGAAVAPAPGQERREGAGARAATAEIPPTVDGPFKQDREKVRNWLVQARQQGVGIKGYLTAYADMEGAVSSGAPEATIKGKLSRLCASIAEQVKASSELARQRRVSFQGKESERKSKSSKFKDTHRWVGEVMDAGKIGRICDKARDDAIKRLTPTQRENSEILRRINKQRDDRYKSMIDKLNKGEYPYQKMPVAPR